MHGGPFSAFYRTGSSQPSTLTYQTFHFTILSLGCVKRLFLGVKNSTLVVKNSKTFWWLQNVPKPVPIDSAGQKYGIYQFSVFYLNAGGFYEFFNFFPSGVLQIHFNILCVKSNFLWSFCRISSLSEHFSNFECPSGEKNAKK